MASSSEEVDRFLWTSASSASEDIDMTTGDIKENGHTKTKKHSIKSDADESLDESVDRKHKKKKKRKLSMDSESELERKVKVELASDLDTKHKEKSKKKKHKDKVKQEDSVSDVANSSQETCADDESYLELCVKQERKRRSSRPDDKQDSLPSDADLTLTNKKKRKRKKSIMELPHNDNDQSMFTSTQIELKQDNVKEESDKIKSESEEDRISKKKKHKKSKKKLNGMDLEDEFSAAETVIQSPPRTRKQNKPHTDSVSSSHKSVDSDDPRKSGHNSQRSTEHEASAANEPVQNSTNITNEHSDSDNRCTTSKVSQSKSMIVSSAPEAPTRKLRISERIAFEDDEEEISYPEPRTPEPQSKTQTDIHKKHVLVNKYVIDKKLQNISKTIPKYSTITKDDEVWLVDVPHEVTSSCLRAVGLPVEGKGKIKIDGSTYDCNIEQDRGHLGLHLCADGKQVISNIQLKGVLHFRKRIPKPHVMEDNTMVNNNQFIPLPETKTRHPLFGAEYREALRLPPSVARRLRMPPIELLEEQRSVKKKNKRKRKHSEASPAAEPSPAPSPSPAPARKKRKKSKREPDAPTWDSAQAIEDNLFNF